MESIDEEHRTALKKPNNYTPEAQAILLRNFIGKIAIREDGDQPPVEGMNALRLLENIQTQFGLSADEVNRLFVASSRQPQELPQKERELCESLNDYIDTYLSSRKQQEQVEVY